MSIDIAGIGSLATAAKGIVDKFWPDKTEVEKALLAAQMQQSINEFKLATAQTDINLEEAKSPMWFVAGWRPFIGWVCGAGLAYDFVVRPISNGLIQAIATLVGHTEQLTLFIALDTNVLMTCLGGMLGLGTLRTYEKAAGAESNRQAK